MNLQPCFNNLAVKNKLLLFRKFSLETYTETQPKYLVRTIKPIAVKFSQNVANIYNLHSNQ